MTLKVGYPYNAVHACYHDTLKIRCVKTVYALIHLGQLTITCSIIVFAYWYLFSTEFVSI